MTWWPGWNSIEGAERGENVFWWLGIACLILLAASEIISRRYGHRKDELVAAARTAQAEEQHRTELATLDRHAAEIAALRRPRERLLKPEAAQSLVAWLAQYAGLRYWIVTQSNDQDINSEQVKLSTQLDRLLLESGWKRSIRLFDHSVRDLPAFASVSDRGMMIWYAGEHVAIKEVAEAFSCELEARNIECSANPRENAPDDMLILEVALR